MANVNAPFGLRWLGLNNSPSTPSSIINGDRKIAPGDTQAARRGDVMGALATGYITTVLGAPMSPALIGNMVGVFWGCRYLSIAQGRTVFSPTWPGGDASGDVDAQIIPLATAGVPNRFLVQATLAPFVFEDIGETVNLSYGTGVTYSSGWSKSGVTADKDDIGTTALPFKIVGLASQIFPPQQNGTDNTSNYNQIIVAFNAGAEVGI